MRRIAGVGVGDRPELVVVVLEDVGVDRPDPHAEIGGVPRETIEVVDPVPRDVQGDARRGAGVGVHLGGVGDLLVGVPRHARLGEDLEPGARVAERPRGQLDGQITHAVDGVRHRVLRSFVMAGGTPPRAAHLLVGRPVAGDEVRGHQRLPALVDRLGLHGGDRLGERSGRLHIPEQRAVVVEEQRVVVPAAALEGGAHLGPHGVVVGAVLGEELGPHLQAEGRALGS